MSKPTCANLSITALPMPFVPPVSANNLFIGIFIFEQDSISKQLDEGLWPLRFIS
jgi:hypothetical protein